MKNKILFIVIPLGVLLFFYLLGAFYNASFDISVWDKANRGEIAIYGGFTACSSVFLVGILNVK